MSHHGHKFRCPVPCPSDRVSSTRAVVETEGLVTAEVDRQSRRISSRLPMLRKDNWIRVASRRADGSVESGANCHSSPKIKWYCRTIRIHRWVYYNSFMSAIVWMTCSLSRLFGIPTKSGGLIRTRERRKVSRSSRRRRWPIWISHSLCPKCHRCSNNRPVVCLQECRLHSHRSLFRRQCLLWPRWWIPVWFLKRLLMTLLLWMDRIGRQRTICNRINSNCNVIEVSHLISVKGGAYLLTILSWLFFQRWRNLMWTCLIRAVLLWKGWKILWHLLAFRQYRRAVSLYRALLRWMVTSSSRKFLLLLNSSW